MKLESKKTRFFIDKTFIQIATYTYHVEYTHIQMHGCHVSLNIKTLPTHFSHSYIIAHMYEYKYTLNMHTYSCFYVCGLWCVYNEKTCHNCGMEDQQPNVWTLKGAVNVQVS